MSIKAKILLSTSLVVVVSLIVSGAIAYLYFRDILSEQAINDDRIRINQTKSHMEYIVDDIMNFSYNP